MNRLLAVLAVFVLSITAVQAADFAEVDTDGDGMVTMDEAKAAMPDLSEDSFGEADADGDGSLNEEEFAALNG